MQVIIDTWDCFLKKPKKVKGGEGWVKGERNPSPLATPGFIGDSGDKVKGKIESRGYTGKNNSISSWNASGDSF